MGGVAGDGGALLWEGGFLRRVFSNFGIKYLLPMKYQVILQLPISIGSWTDLRITMDASLG